MDNKMKKLECPFTWQISKELIINFYDDEEPKMTSEKKSVYYMIKSIMCSYIRIVQQNYKGAMEYSQITDSIWKGLDDKQMKEEGVSSNVLQHILNATKYHLYKSMNDGSGEELMKKLWKTLQDAESFQSDLEKGTLNGCKGIAFATLYKVGYEKAIPFAEKAIDLSPNCATWHLLLGNSLRFQRRNLDNYREPSEAERMAFLKSHELSKDIFTGILVAQMYHECKEIKQARDMYREIFKSKPQSSGVLLRLAKVFIIFGEFEKAEVCFDEAKLGTKYYHYKGMLYEKQKNWQMAAQFFKKAAEVENFRAELQYAMSMTKVDKNYDLTIHLKVMLKKYEKYAHYQQQILIHLAMQYGEKKCNIENSLTYFLKAIQLNPQSNQLKNFYNITVDGKNYIIFDFVFHKIRMYKARVIPNHMQDIVTKLEDLCYQHKDIKTDSVSRTINNLAL